MTYTIIAARQPAWQRLGAEFSDLLTTQEALDNAGLSDWNVRGVPSGGQIDPDDPLSWTAVESKMRPVRDTEDGPAFLGKDEVGSGFQFWQNEQTAEFAQQVAGVFGDERIVSTAGFFENGAKVFLCLELDGFTVLGEDAHNQYLTVANGHNGGLALTAVTGAIRVVCRNTFDGSLHQSNKVAIRHQGDMLAKAGEAAMVLGVARDWNKAYGRLAEELASQPMSVRQFERGIRSEFIKPVPVDATPRVRNRNDRNFETVMANFTSSPTTEVGRGTRWAGLNAITEWVEWGRPGDLSTERAAVANLFGSGVTLRAKALKVMTS